MILLSKWRDDIAWLSAALGAASGWVVGTFISPYGRDEGEQFGNFGKLASAFLTGFLLTKVDRLFDLTFPLLSDERFIRRLMVGMSCFLVAMIIVFIARRYYPIEENKAGPETKPPVGGGLAGPVAASIQDAEAR